MKTAKTKTKMKAKMAKTNTKAKTVNKAKAKDKDKDRDEDGSDDAGPGPSVTTRWEGVPPKLNLSSFLLFCPHLLLLTTSMNRVQWSREQNSGDARQ